MGKVRVAAQAPGYLPAEQEFTITSDQWTTARLQLEKAPPQAPAATPQAPAAPPQAPAAQSPSPAPPPAATATTGNLIIQVNAMRATIYLNGTKVGHASPGSPLTVPDLPVGKVEVTAKAAGYQEHSKRVTVVGGDWVEVEIILALATS